MPIKDASRANLAKYSNAEIRRLQHYLDIPEDVLGDLLKRPESSRGGHKLADSSKPSRQTDL